MPCVLALSSLAYPKACPMLYALSSLACPMLYTYALYSLT